MGDRCVANWRRPLSAAPASAVAHGVGSYDMDGAIGVGTVASPRAAAQASLAKGTP